MLIPQELQLSPEEQGELLRVKALLYGLAGEPITKSGLCT